MGDLKDIDVYELFKVNGIDLDKIIYDIEVLNIKVKDLERALDNKSKLAGAAAVKMESLISLMEENDQISIKDLNSKVKKIVKELTSSPQEVEKTLNNGSIYGYLENSR